MHLILENRNLLLQGLYLTLRLSFTTLILSIAMSLVFGVFATLKYRWLRTIVLLYVEFFRGIPLLVNIFSIYFILPMLHFRLSGFWSVTIGLTLWGSANGIEIVRASLQSISKHQVESAWALGLTSFQIYTRIIIPEALRSMIPPFTGLLTLIVQATSLGALVGATEFLNASQIIIERSVTFEGTNPAFTIYLSVLLIYFLICSALTKASKYLEMKLAD